MAKVPYKIDCRKSLDGDRFFILVDGDNVEQGQVPSGLEEFLTFDKFIRTFAEGAQSVVFERPGEADIVYCLEGDQVRGDYRSFLYKKV